MKKVLLAITFFLGLLLITPMVQAGREIVSSSDREKPRLQRFGYEKPTTNPALNLNIEAPASDEPSSSGHYVIVNDYTTTVNQTFPKSKKVDTSAGNTTTFQIDHSGDASLPDMNSTVPMQPATASATTNLHNGIDEHYIKALPYWTKEGHWFPKAGYSQIRYQVVFETYVGVFSWKTYVKVQSGADTYSRYLRLYLDGSKVGETAIGSGTNEAQFGFDLWWGGTHTLTVEIYWGGLVDYGWKLAVMEVYDPSGVPPPVGSAYHAWHYRRDLDTEFFPMASYSRLEFNVLLGPNSWAYIKIDRQDDTLTRYFWIYVDGVKKNGDQDTTPLSKPFYLGEYSRGSLHKLRLEIYWGAYKDYGWKLDMKQFKVYYDSLAVEVDYMSASDHNHKPNDYEIVTVVTDYYTLHGAQNILILVDQAVNDTTYQYSDGHKAYYRDYFQHKGQYGWKYVLIGHYSGDYPDYYGYTFAAPPDVPLQTMVFIADQKIQDDVNSYWWLFGVTYAKLLRAVFMHEIGHTVGIIVEDAGGNEVYCPQQYSVMGPGLVESGCAASDGSQEYDWEHWSLRSMP